MVKARRFRLPAICLTAALSLAGLGTLAAPAHAANEILYVDDTASTDAGNDCRDPSEPCETLQHAVGLATNLEGDITIRVRPGDYAPTNAVTLPRAPSGLLTSLTIIGAGTSDVPAEGTTLRTGAFDFGRAAIVLLGDPLVAESAAVNYEVTIAELRITAGVGPAPSEAFPAIGGIGSFSDHGPTLGGGPALTVRGVLIESLTGGRGADGEAGTVDVGPTDGGAGGGAGGIGLGGDGAVLVERTEVRNLTGGDGGTGGAQDASDSNAAEGGAGGYASGISMDTDPVTHPTVTVDDSTFAGFTAGKGGLGGSAGSAGGGHGGHGGGVMGLFQTGAPLVVTDSTITNLRAGDGNDGGNGDDGGGNGGNAGSAAGVWVDPAASAALTHVTITDVFADSTFGGGGTDTDTGSSMARTSDAGRVQDDGTDGDLALFDAGLLVETGGTAVLTASLLHNLTANCQVEDPAPGPDVLVEGGFNAFGERACPFTPGPADTTEAGIEFGAEPDTLEELAPNPPGTTRTIAVGPVGIAATVVTDGPLCQGADQRGALRPAPTCAAGAYEPNPRPPAPDDGPDKPEPPIGPPPPEPDSGLCGAITKRPSC